MRLLKERYVRWIGIFFVAFIVMQFDDEHLSHEPMWYQYFVSWIFTAVYWNGAYLIFMMFRKIFPEIKQTGRRLVLTYIVLFIWMTFGGVPVKFILGLMTWQEVFTLKTYSEFMAMNLIIALIVGTIYETVYFFENWKDAIQQNEELKNRQIRTQFEVLQNQMSPHFLFNSLNTLTTLIAENQEVAIDFTQKLSDVYRYILQNKEKELVTLKEEVAFVQDYLYLLKMRYPDNLRADFRIGSEFMEMHVAPLTIQILVENCIKHNVVSKANPLAIDIYVENGKSVVVKNNLQLKKAIEKSTKTGLENIQKRYEYLGNRKIDVIHTVNSFMVAVPLIEVSYERGRGS
ncbi:MAG: histidine kinase [Marinoscillum sp.]